jgi:hypothetical protein
VNDDVDIDITGSNPERADQRYSGKLTKPSQAEKKMISSAPGTFSDHLDFRGL